jgi:Cys-rich protein (TIGR01571 family)
MPNQVVDAPPGSVEPTDLEGGGGGWVSNQPVRNGGAQQYASVVPFSEDTPPMMGGWLVGLCGCCTDLVPNCCMVTFCPCVSLAQISKRIGVSSYCCGLCLSCVFSTCLSACLPLWICHLRSATRRRFRIPGNCCGDYCEACCCPCCAIAQMATRAGSYTPGSCSFGSLDSLPPYKHV